MNDDELRRTLHEAHAEDRAPSFEATLAASRARTPRRWPVVAGALVVAATAAIVAFFVTRAAPPPAPPGEAIGMRTTTLHLPLDSLLDIPDQGMLSTAPDLTRGELP
jgi:hypothetical protein